MKKRQLDPENVELLIVQSSNTAASSDLSMDDLLAARVAEGYPDIGFHYVITRNGTIHTGISVKEAGTHTERFDSNSLGILIIGGRTERHHVSDNYTKSQRISLGYLTTTLKDRFPHARVVGYGDLHGGTNPHTRIDHG